MIFVLVHLEANAVEIPDVSGNLPRVVGLRRIFSVVDELASSARFGFDENVLALNVGDALADFVSIRIGSYREPNIFFDCTPELSREAFGVTSHVLWCRLKELGYFL